MTHIYSTAELSKLPIKDIVALCIRKNQQACTFLYNEYAPYMLRLCKSFTKRDDIAKDLMQEGFITAFCKMDKLKNRERVKSWIYRIMINKCIYYINHSMFNYEDIESAWDVASPKQSDVLEYQDLCKKIDQLSEKYKVVFVKHIIDGYSYEEIAKEYNIKEPTVRSMVCRAKMNLQHNIETI